MCRQTMDRLSIMGYNILVRQRETSYERREDMEEMTANQTLRLIEWLKANGFDDSKIVECLEFINSTNK